MLFLLFKLGKDRYVLEASRVVEVLPLVDLRKIPQAPRGVAGIFNYHGRPVPAIDLSELALGQPAREHLSTRIILVNYPDEKGQPQPLGLIAEHATEIIRRESAEFVDPGLKLGAAAYLGPVLMDGDGAIQWVYEQRLLPERVRDLLFCEIVEPVP
ncbi:MAG: cheW-like domain protein [Pedosphaera sp.]|nr:cheW-like domain protein [Pedosphaera sp.]